MATKQPILAPGLEIDGYILLERIFSGGMGTIWRARRAVSDGAGHPPIVLKIPFIAAGSDVAAIVAFEIEEMIMTRLTGPHVPKVYGTGDLSALPYIAMEYVEGRSLADVMDGAPVAADAVLAVGQHLARAVASIHRQHVIHLDLKPANVIMAARGAVLIDFGLARHDELPDLMGEETRLPVGSAAYMAPEQTFGDRRQPASDFFAIGAMLFELATGTLPFGLPGTVHGLKKREAIDPVDLSPRLAGLPPGLREIILTCLDPKPGERYPSADQLLFDLNHADQIVVRPRTRRKTKAWYEKWGDWWAEPVHSEQAAGGCVSDQLHRAPVILAAVDLSRGADPLAEAVRLHVKRALQAEPRARLACITVLKSRVLGEDPLHDIDGRSPYHGRLIALKDWARGLTARDDKVSFHVLEGVDAAGTILDYVAHNGIDHIVMGARSSSTFRRHLGSVSAKVVAGAPCSVTVVRVRHVADGVEPELQAGADLS